MIISSWNVRGMNSPDKTKEVRHFLETNNISVIGLMETKIKEAKVENIFKKLGNNWNWRNNYNHHAKGRIWVGWGHDRCNLESWMTHKQFIATKITPINTGESFQVIFVYGLHNVSDRGGLWIEPQQVNLDTPCLFIGDLMQSTKRRIEKMDLRSQPMRCMI